jgi:hypothetical protein
VIEKFGKDDVKKKPALIVIRNYEDKWHMNHPVNLAIKLVNQFTKEAFMKLN